MSIKITNINKGNNFNFLDIREGNRISNDSNDFLTKFTKASEKNLKEQLSALINDIDEQSKKIEKNLNLNDILRYKKLIREFLNLAVNNSHKFSKESYLDRRGGHRIMSIIRKVDEELENLTKDILDKEKNRLKILKRMDGIRGMLIDIFM